jgi:cyclic beta-1,2-glucan synthetase
LGDAEEAEDLRHQAEELQTALEESAWDGKWYIRARYDDGTPLGSAENEECQIASMAQSWAVLSGAGDPQRIREAMEAVAERLVHESGDAPPGVIHLFTPPFDETPHDPGYIKGYPPGIRENGGQYTHAALWAVWAFTEMGDGDRAGALFEILNPVRHSDTSEKMRRYGVEPYVVAADVYSAEGWFGRGGWTWYTGSSGWMYRLGVEAILGLRRSGDGLRIEPCIPSDWPGYRIEYRSGATTYRVEVENPEGHSTGVRMVTMDGEELTDGIIPLEESGGEHDVVVKMG